jgi:hypothetical protein
MIMNKLPLEILEKIYIYAHPRMNINLQNEIKNAFIYRTVNRYDYYFYNLK